MADPQVFKNRYAAVKWLQENGYKVRKSKLYKDADAGLLRMESDGTVTIESLRRYIDHPEAGIKEHMDTVSAGNDVEVREYHRRAAVAKAEKTELEAKKLRWEMEKEEGKWIPRADLEMEMAARAAVLDQGLSSLVSVRAEAWIHLAGGNPNRAPDLKAAIAAEVDALLGAFVQTDTFTVMFENDEGSDGEI